VTEEEAGVGSSSPSSLLLGGSDLSLATDLYQLTMAAAYWTRGELPQATYELYVRRLPEHRNFLVFAGLEQVLAGLEGLQFHREQIDYLRSLAPFSTIDPGFFDALAEFRFRGDVWAMEEGRIFFPQEPVLRVTGTLLEAQIVETLLLSIVNFQTLIASKAARIRLAAGPDVDLAEFGTRRAHGPEAGVWGARAAYLGGFDSTSNVLAGQRVGIPVVGTMAHSFVLSFATEAEAFKHYRNVFPDHTVHLVDTYDTLEGVRQAIATGGPFAGIRIDSGDVEALSRGARDLLDRAGFREAKIFVSGDMHELRIQELLRAGAPIDAFGVGTRLVSSTDSPTIGGVYKLVELEEGGVWVPKRKRSAGKTSFAGSKQVLRELESGRMVRDRLVPARGREWNADRSEPVATPAGAVELLAPAIVAGDRVRDASLTAARERFLSDLAALPDRLRELGAPSESYEVEVDPQLAAV